MEAWMAIFLHDDHAPAALGEQRRNC